jgi:hypothetical protein
MQVYDKERSAALLREARELTAGLREEIGSLAMLVGLEEDRQGNESAPRLAQGAGVGPMVLRAPPARPARLGWWRRILGGGVRRT